MKYQATACKPSKLATYSQIMNDPSTAAVALDEWERDNPEGAGRKKLVDWAAYERRHGTRSGVTHRQGETLYDIADYWVHRGQPYGKTRAESDAEFREKAKGPYDREGQGPTLQLWLPDLRRRMRDTTRYEDTAAVEGSRQMKDPSHDERKHLQDLAGSARGSHESAFLQGWGKEPSPASSPAAAVTPTKRGREEDGVEETDAPSSKKPRVDICDEGPRQYGCHESAIPSNEQLMEKALDKIMESVMSTAAMPDEQDPELKAYRATAHFRFRLGKIWEAKTVEEARHFSTIALDNLLPAAYGKDKITEGMDKQGEAEKGEKKNEDANQAKEKEDAKKAKENAKKMETGEGGQELAASGAAKTECKSEDTQSRSSADNTNKRPTESKPEDTASRASSDNTVHEQITKILRDCLKTAGRISSVIQQPDHLTSLMELQAIRNKMLEAENLQALDGLVLKFKNSANQVALLINGIKKSASNLKTHTDNLLRKSQRQAKAREREVEMAEVNAARAKAKAAAARVKDEEKQKVSPVFQMSVHTLETEELIVKVPIMENVAENNKVDPDKPFILRGADPIATWTSDAKIQVALSSFGGKYKKKAGYQSEGKVQMNLYAREGKEETDALFETLAAKHMPANTIVDPTGTNAAGACQQCWLFGNDPHVKHASFAPNCLSMCKILVQGEIQWLAAPISDLLTGLRTLSGLDKIDLDKLKELALDLDMEKLKRLKEAGCWWHSAKQLTNDMLYIPPGWYCLEAPSKGVLVYGVRKTFITKSSTSHANFEAAAGVFSASNSAAAEHMMKLLEKFESS